jgi:hypothetical protein
MIRGGKTGWRALEVLRTGPGQVGELDAGERLAALYRFQNGVADDDHAFIAITEGRSRVEVKSPADVDWDAFPVLAALEAVTRDELRRLRRILRSDPANNVDEDPPAPTTSGTWALPSFPLPEHDAAASGAKPRAGRAALTREV